MDFSSASSEGEQILLIGNFSFTTETLQSLSTLGQLLVCQTSRLFSFIFTTSIRAPSWSRRWLRQLLQELDGGDRKSFLNACRSGQYDRVSVIVRTFESIAVRETAAAASLQSDKLIKFSQLTGPFDSELIEALPNSVKFIAHNGVGYDQINVSRCAAKGSSRSPRILHQKSRITSSFRDIGLKYSRSRQRFNRQHSNDSRSQHSSPHPCLLVFSSRREMAWKLWVGTRSQRLNARHNWNGRHWQLPRSSCTSIWI